MAKDKKPFDKFAPTVFEKIEAPINDAVLNVQKPEIKQEVLLEVAEEKPLSIFNFILIVANPFDGYQLGAMISNDEAIQRVIDEGMLINCRKIKRG